LYYVMCTNAADAHWAKRRGAGARPLTDRPHAGLAFHKRETYKVRENPMLDVLERLARALKVKVGELVE
jgi:hypothetical protein